MLSSAPNILTLSRIAIIPLLVVVFYFDGAWARWLALALFAIAGTTDFADGYLARNMQQHSSFGRWLDPVADKLLVGATVVMLVGFDRAPLLPALVILLRELTVSGLREYMAEIQVGMPVSRLAKWKTGIQMTAIGFLIIGSAGPTWLPVEDIGFWGLWVASALTLITGYDYLRAGLEHMLKRTG